MVRKLVGEGYERYKENYEGYEDNHGWKAQGVA